jgi:MFS family permease
MSTSPPQGLRTFLIIWLGQLISILGSGLTSFALSVWIFQQTQQATPFAISVLLSTLPRLLITPFAGVLADRQSRRLIMILADTGSALTSLALLMILAAGHLQVWHIYLIVTLSSLCAAFQEPAYTASISMLVPKAHLARANGMIQMGQALEMILSPVLAGLLFVAAGLEGILLIDFLTFFFAVGALLAVRIPQPRLAEGTESRSPRFLAEAAFGWTYLRQRTGLFGMLWYFALVNFLLNIAGVLAGPLVLAFSTARELGLIQMVLGVGMLAGSLAISAWGGPQKRIRGLIGFIALAGAGLVVTSWQPKIVSIGGGLLMLTFFIPPASGLSQAIFQAKVAPNVQGRVFAMRSLISRSMMPAAYALAGPLADRVFEPWMSAGGPLASTPLGALLGTGSGRGIGVMYLASGLLLLVASAAAYAHPRIRNVETELPDAPIEDYPEAAASLTEASSEA